MRVEQSTERRRKEAKEYEDYLNKLIADSVDPELVMHSRNTLSQDASGLGETMRSQTPYLEEIA